MKRTSAIVILLGAFSSATFGVILFFIDAPLDDPNARAGVRDRPELKPLHDAYSDIIKMRLLPMKFGDIPQVFGPKLDTATNWWGYGTTGGERSGPNLDRRPADRVLPLVAPRNMMVSGIHSIDPARNKNHSDLHAIGDFVVGDIGYVEFYSQNDGERVQNAAIYFCADEKFVPLRSTNDFSKRLEWEKAKFDALRLWLAEHMP